MSFLWTLCLGVATLLLSIYLYFQYKFTYWTKRNVYHINPKFPLGNFQGINRQYSFGQIVKNIYDNNKNQPVVGTWIFARPALVIRDLELIKKVLIKEFNSFMDRGIVQASNYDPLIGHLFFLRGKKWRNIRIKLTPTFTSGKMKMMFPTMLKCGENFKMHLEKLAENGESIEIRNVLSNFTLDVIASCAFGLEIDAFNNPNSDFKKMGDFLIRPSMWQSMKNFVAFTLPVILETLKWPTIPEKTTKFFTEAVKDTFEYREKNNVERNDFLQLLLELKNKGKIEDAEVYKHGELELADEEYDPTFTVNQAAAQAFVFIVAGSETSSSTMMFALFELAQHQDMQDKLREEMDRVIAKHGGEITYDGLLEMEYLDQVVSETLRKYPTVPFLNRECTKNCYFPEINAVIEKGTRILIPPLALHHDPELFPDPEKFDPERFSAENKKNRHPMSYLPFGDGPRICIGMRFGLMQTKAGLTLLLSNYKVEISEKTNLKLKINTKAQLTAIVGGIDLRIRKR